MCFVSQLRAAFLVIVGILAGSFPAFAQAPTKQWDNTFGGDDQEELLAMQLTPDGGYIAGGYSLSGISGDKTQASRGDRDYWVIKVDGNGNKQWDRRFGGNAGDAIAALQPTRDGGYLLAGSSNSGISGDKTQASRGDSDYWLVKLDANGNKVWDKTFGGSRTERLWALQQMTDDGYVIGGWSNSGADGDKTQANQGDFDYWVLRLDVNGNKLWDRTIGGKGLDFLNALQLASDGGYVLAGYSDSGISGDKTEASRGSLDYWIVKLDASGTKQWDRTFGGNSGDLLYALQRSLDGGYLLGGYSSSAQSGDKTQASHNSADYWVVKVDAHGNKLWDKTFGGNQEERLYALQACLDGGYLLGGYSESGFIGDKTQPSRGKADYWVVRIDAQGNKRWDSAFGGESNDILQALQFTPDGGYLLAGSSYSGVYVDKTQPSKGGGDYWVLKLNPEVVTASTSSHARHTLGVYPNPTHGQLTLQLPEEASTTSLQLTIWDVTGRSVLKQSLVPTLTTRVLVEVGAQPAGLYLLRVEGRNGFVATQRFFLQ